MRRRRERFPPQRLAGVLGGVCENREACPAGVGVHVNDLPAGPIANLERRAAWISLNLNQPWSGLGADVDQRSAGIRPDDGANCRILQILCMEPGQLPVLWRCRSSATSRHGRAGRRWHERRRPARTRSRRSTSDVARRNRTIRCTEIRSRRRMSPDRESSADKRAAGPPPSNRPASR
jgi:hypothetical protein